MKRDFNHSIKTIRKVNEGHRLERKRLMKKLKNKIDIDFAFILGSILGDGCITIRKRDVRTMAQITLSSKDKDYTEAFKRVFESWSQSKCRLFFYKNVWIVRCCSLAVARVLKEFDENKILDFSDDIKGMFLRGLFDSDGSIDDKGKRIVFTNAHINLINLVEKNLKSLNIGYNTRKDIRKIRFLEGRMLPESIIFSVRVTGRLNIQRFYEKIGFYIGRKQQRLENILSNYKRFIKKWSEDEIQFMKNSIDMKPRVISKKLGRSSNSIWQKRYVLKRLSRM